MRLRILPILVVTALALAAPASAAGPAAAPGTSARSCLQLGPVSVEPGEPVGRTPCPGVRPGALVTSAAGGCSLNFLFRGGDGARYIGTAGHCVASSGTDFEEGEKVWARGKGIPAFDADGERIGEYAYAALIREASRDFALIRLDPGVKASPRMCHWGGPTGTNDDRSSADVVVRHYGNGIGVGREWVTGILLVPARTALARGMEDPDYVQAHGAASFGDSGSGAISEDGRALGVIVHLVVVPGWQGAIGMTRLPPQLAMAEDALGIDLRLRKGKFPDQG